MRKPYIKRFFLILTALLSVLISAFLYNDHIAAAENEENEKDEPRILFISSYSYAWDTVQIQIEGIKEGISEDVVLDYEFMDTKRFPDAESIQVFYEGLAYRLERLEPYDVVIVGDDAALLFAMEHKDDIFSGIPIVFEGINDEAYAIEIAEDPLITGVLEKLSFQKNIDFALTLYPNATKVVALLDDTVTGEAERRSFYSYAPSYPDLEFSEINTSSLTTSELIEALSSIGTDSILIYIVMTEDASGRIYTSHQSIRMVAEHSSVPALRMVSGGIGEGLLGGNIVSMELSGKIAAEMADAIAHGKDPAEYNVIVDSPNIYYIDEAVMRKYDLDLSLIPKDAQVINHLPSFWEKYHEVLPPVAIIICLLIVIIVLLYRRNTKQVLLTKKLKTETDELEKTSTYDYLTGLANRSKLYADLSEIEKRHSICSLFIFDIDGFKQINDTYGHNTGDEVLSELGRRLASIDDALFTPYRLAGDEFVCLYKTNSEQKIETLARQCMLLFQDEFHLTDISLPINISLGIAVCPNDCNSASKLIECADRAMYTVKRSGKNSYAWYRDIKRN